VPVSLYSVIKGRLTLISWSGDEQRPGRMMISQSEVEVEVEFVVELLLEFTTEKQTSQQLLSQDALASFQQMKAQKMHQRNW
jgi:hypothetical protein